ncbi:MAG: hypothetical protein AAB215_04800 [Planctomycetota bacterium]
MTIRADVLEAASPFLEEVVRRARPARFLGEEVLLASCEDLVLMKLGAGRAIDRADAVELLRANALSLDAAYLKAQSSALGLSAELAACEQEARTP